MWAAAEKQKAKEGLAFANPLLLLMVRRSRSDRLEPRLNDRAPGIIRGKLQGNAMPFAGASVYILFCADGSYYTGLTRKEVERRVNEHNSGVFGGHTGLRRPVRLVYSAHFD